MFSRPSLASRVSVGIGVLVALANSTGEMMSRALSVAGSDSPLASLGRRGGKGTGRRAPKRQQRFKTWHGSKRKAKSKARRRRMRG